MDQGDVTLLEIGEILRGATARGSAGRRDNDAAHELKFRSDVIAARVVPRGEVFVRYVGRKIRGCRVENRIAILDEQLVIEFLARYVVAGALKLAGDVVSRGGVPWGSRRPRTLVGVRYGLELPLMLQDTPNRDRLA